MAKTVFALITLLDDGNIGLDPGFGNRPGGGGHPSQPIYHPGHPEHGRPVDPGFGQGGANRPDNSLPWSPNSPDNSLPVPPGVQPPHTPPALQDKLVVLWRLPNTTEWHGKAIDKGHPDAGLPPAPEPKS